MPADVLAPHQHFVKLLPILITHEPVSKHPAGLMQPQAGKRLLAVACAGGGHEDSLELLAQVTQVEGVVALCRCRQQLLRYPAARNRQAYIAMLIRLSVNPPFVKSCTATDFLERCCASLPPQERSGRPTHLL
jgi:hypothetical protein